MGYHISEAWAHPLWVKQEVLTGWVYYTLHENFPRTLEDGATNLYDVLEENPRNKAPYNHPTNQKMWSDQFYYNDGKIIGNYEKNITNPYRVKFLMNIINKYIEKRDASGGKLKDFDFDMRNKIMGW